MKKICFVISIVIFTTFGNTSNSSKATLEMASQGDCQFIEVVRNIALQSLEDFKKNQRRNICSHVLDYDDNGCSSPFGVGGSLDLLFYDACDQHDFGYRNGEKHPELHTLSFKASVDKKFLSNMFTICEQTYETYTHLKDCYYTAEIYYSSVSNFSVNVYWIVVRN